ncbi:unnamed protein product [Orchesella dallaii]|uniref:Gustatory receptor n=1 Tax=Orchesella dallaii TaxID=48710 RepID=A0ABP1RBT2_9HEXA
MESLLRKIFNQVEQHGTGCFTWDTKTRKLILFDEVSSKNVNRTCDYLILGNVIILLQIFVGELSQTNGLSKGDSFNRLLTAYLIAALPILCVQIQVCRNKAREIVLYINGLLRLPIQNFWKDVCLIHRVNLAYAWVWYVTISITPTVMVIGLHWKNPCRSTLLGGWLLPECRTTQDDAITKGIFHMVWRFLSKTVVLVINHLLWSKSLSSGIVCMVVLQNLCMLLQLENLKRFSNTFSKSKVLKPGEILKFREIQMLALLNNVIIQNALLMFTFCMIILISLAITVFVKLEWNTENIMAFTLFSCSGSNATQFFLMCMGGGMIGIYSTSKELFAMIKRKQKYTTGKTFLTVRQHFGHKRLTRFCRSCTPIRIKLGESNFVEELTPLKCISAAVELTVNVLLLCA